MVLRLLPLLIGISTPAFAGQPGEGEAVGYLGASGVLDDAARVPLGLGVDGRVGADLLGDLGLDLRGELLHTRMPPREIEDFILNNTEDPESPDKIAFSQWEGRLSLAAAFRPTSREQGLRARFGVIGVISGSAGATSSLPTDWNPDYTAAFRAGPVATVGWALPFGQEVGDPLLDVRLGASWAVPIGAGGGLLADAAAAESILTVDDRNFGKSGLIGREARGFVEGTLVFGDLFIGAQAGIEHNARSEVARARAASDAWEVEDIPEKVAPHAQLTFGFIF